MTKSRLLDLLFSSLFSSNAFLRRFNKHQLTNDNPTMDGIPIANPSPKASRLLLPDRCSLPESSEGVGCSAGNYLSALFPLRFFGMALVEGKEKHTSSPEEVEGLVPSVSLAYDGAPTAKKGDFARGIVPSVDPWSSTW